MMERLALYSLAVFFVFYLINYSEGVSDAFKATTRGLPDWLGYPLGCAFCFAFWGTLVAFLGGAVPDTFTLTAPVVVMFIDIAYRRLQSPYPPS